MVNEAARQMAATVKSSTPPPLVKAVSQLFPNRYAATGQALYLAGAHGFGMSLCTYWSADFYAAVANRAFLLPLAMTAGGVAAWYASMAAIRLLDAFVMPAGSRP